MNDGILVTGGTGQIGAEVVRQLVRLHHRVVVIDFTPNLANIADVLDDVVVVQGDIADLSFLMKVARRERVTRIAHLAAFLFLESDANPMRTVNVNIVGSGNILDTAVALDIERVCYASTTAVFGPPEMYGDSLVTETSPTSPMHLYGVSKRTVEILAETYRNLYGLDAVGIRPAYTYGVGRYTGGMGGFNSAIRDIALGRDAVLGLAKDLTTRIQLIHTTDMARAFVAATIGPPTPLSLYNAPVTETISFQEIIEILQDVVPDARIAHEPPPVDWGSPLIDGRAAQRDLGVVPRIDFRTGASEMIAWFREHAEGAGPGRG